LRKPEGHFYVATRRGKQFNSMIYGEKDPFNAANRYDILMNENDAKKLDIKEGEAIVAYNKYGTFSGRAKFEPVREGNIEVHWQKETRSFLKAFMNNLPVFQNIMLLLSLKKLKHIMHIKIQNTLKNVSKN